jgi:hypothetical protein
MASTDSDDRSAVAETVAEISLAIVRVKPLVAEAAMYNRDLLMATLRMLKARDSPYLVDGLIASLGLADTPMRFQSAVLAPEFKNPIRDIIATNYKKKNVPSLRVMMSMLVRNSPNDTYTAIFFAQQKETLVSKKLAESFFQTLLVLNSSNIHVTETIFVSPTQFSSASEADRKQLANTCFSQMFFDKEILAPPTGSVYAPRVKIYTASETRAFFEKEPRFAPSRMQQMPSQGDAMLRYLGCRPQRVVEVTRANIVPSASAPIEMSFAWAY